MQVYLDNAATTRLDPDVISIMAHCMQVFYGNPSSTHSKGREARVELEKARKKIASLVGTHEKEIIFTSGGTEANNSILKSLALDKKINRIITSPIEHHSILDSLSWIEAHTNVSIFYLDVDEKGNVDIDQLGTLLQQGMPTLVSLMHGNNEIGNLLDLTSIGELCKKHNALFHSDMVQTLGHYPIKLNDLPLDFATASAHKCYGPKGVGFIYVNSKSSKLSTFSHGGAQERGIRGGTENVIGIIGMAKAYEISLKNIPKDQHYITSLKEGMIHGIRKKMPQVTFNGNSSNLLSSLYNLINVKINDAKDETLLFNLDINGVFVSEGSACSSGALEGSHVLKALNKKADLTNNLRISLSKYTTVEEIDQAIKVISNTVNQG